MRVHHLNCGTFCPFGRRLVNGRGGLVESGRIVCHCQLIETRAGLVLVDTGLGLEDVAQPMSALPGQSWQAIMRPQLRREETAIEQVRDLGFKPVDVRHIVMTHLDFDHAGGLSDFPWAKVHVFAREYDAAVSRPTPRERMRYAPRQIAHRPDFAMYTEQGENWFGFKAVRELFGLPPEILMVPLPGHSRGHCGVAIQTDSDGWLLNCGDAAFWHGELNSRTRHCPPVLRIYQNIFQFDHVTRMHNQHRLRELVQDHGDQVSVFCSHDPEMMRQFAHAAHPRAARATGAATLNSGS